MQASINRFIDFFIKDKASLSPESIYQARTILSISAIIFFLAIPLVFLEMFDYFASRMALCSAIFFASLMLLMKFHGSLKLVSCLLLVGGFMIIVLDITNTGEIYSYNHKWFVVLLLLTSFFWPRLTFPLLILCCFYQLFSYLVTDTQIQGLASKEEYLYNNLVILISSYVCLVVLIKMKTIQQSTIDKQNDRLLKQKGELIRSNKLLQQRSEQLMVSNQELERFAYIASHDLKTPLNNVISFSRLLEKEIQSFANKNAHAYFQFIKNGSLKMNTLIEDVLEYSKVSSKNGEAEEVDLNQVIDAIHQSISEYIAEKNAELVVLKPLPIIQANRTKMYLLFKNLIENGITYNESKSPVVKVDYEYVENHIDLTIQDNGIGIDPKYHQNIFEMFSRLHRDNEYKGTGLGLALCKRIVDHLAGTISIQSQPEKGTQFIIRLDKRHFPELSNS